MLLTVLVCTFPDPFRGILSFGEGLHGFVLCCVVLCYIVVLPPA